MKISYAIENLRSLNCTPYIELRPITILVGRNSAGKSTFLRSLALLRQSLEAKSSAPILWYGDYVDFGDFGSAVNRRDIKKEVSFKFSAENFTSGRRYRPYQNYYDAILPYNTRPKGRKYSKINLSISLAEQAGRTIRRSLILEDPSHHILLSATFGKDGRTAESFVVNDYELTKLLPTHSVVFDSGDIFSTATIFTSVRVENRRLRRLVNPIVAFSNYIAGFVSAYVDKRILLENIEIEARRMLSYPILSKAALKTLSENSDTLSFKRFYLNLLSKKYDDLHRKINIACAMNYVLQALSDSGHFFRDFFLRTTYLGPARARSERYYRFQELEVSEIAPDGHNLAMFFGSLDSNQLNRFSDWVAGLFGFGVGVHRSEGHISIQLKRDELDVNVADTGYGVSQLLPVLAQIWWSSMGDARHKRARGYRETLYPITMEQPELHLHPAHQARLADALLNALPSPNDESDSTPVFVVETHSEALINRLGELIEAGKLTAESVQIVIFSSANESSNSTKINTSNYNSEGVLNNWPFGFFNY